MIVRFMRVCNSAKDFLPVRIVLLSGLKKKWRNEKEMNKLDNLKMLQVELWSEYRYSEASYAPTWITETPFTRENIKLLAEVVDDAIIRMRKTPTNFDKVTASPEKLIEFATHTMFPVIGCRYTGKLKCPNTNCKECMLDWLKQEAEEEKE